MASEQALSGNHDTKVDVWSLGCLMLDLLGIESTPWSYYNEEYLLIDDLQNYRRQNTYMNKTFIEYFQDRLKHFRNTLGLQSPYTEDFKRYNGVIESLPQGLQDLLNEMFKANPEERCDINHVVTTLSSP